MYYKKRIKHAKKQENMTQKKKNDTNYGISNQ